LNANFLVLFLLKFMKSILTSVIQVAVCLFLIPVESGEISNEKNVSPTVVTIETEKTLIRVLNAKHHKAHLSHVTKNGRVEVAQIDPKLAVQTFVVPSGIYVVTDDETSLSYAAPALAELVSDQPLEIKIGGADLSDREWAWIPAGHSLIGDTIGVGARDEPLSLQTFKPFWLCRTAVTNRQYAEFLNANIVKLEWIDLASRKCCIGQDSSGTYVVTQQESYLPVVMVSHAGAEAYCEWLSKSNGRKYRLPTEFEWEKAARGPSSFVYSYGNIYQQRSANQESGTIAAVGSFNPNEYGLYDMTGNVFEWMSNEFDTTTPGKVMNQSLRGGSFVLDGIYQRNSFRMRQSKTVMTDDIGFRVLREATLTELKE
jgi:formylglycine-generating enzyme required for sulfatase activity